MEKITVTVEFTDNNYSAFIESLSGCVAIGDSLDDLKENLKEAIDLHVETSREYGEYVPKEFLGEYELVFTFDVKSLLTHYNGIFTNAALQRLTGINQRQLQRYARGESRPKKEQVIKISQALHKLGHELIAVEL
jgi:predicted RNase H-like HicB family nuclease